MFTRTFYLRLDERRLRIDSPGAIKGYDDVAAIALRDASTKQARIEAIGRAAEALRGQPQITVSYPFAHPRMVFGDFTIAERLLMLAVRSFHRQQGWTFFRPIVRVIVHPLRDLDGGLTQIETRALIELAQNCGARKVAVHSGRELTSPEIERYGAWSN